MEPERRRQLVLAVLVVVLAVVIYKVWPRPSAGPAVSSNDNRTAGRAGRGSAPAAGAEDVHLRSLESERPKPDAETRNVFRFRERRAPPPPVSAARIGPAPPEGPPQAQVPPIPFKFIGIVEAPAESRRIAVLSDGRGMPYYGREGETVVGQYRILRIGAESIEMSYLDGRGRQTIRLTGQ
jgi:hypothetical protein